MNIYVGNLPFSMTEAEFRETFEAYGEVSSANIILDRATGRSRGFGFVEMPNDGEAQEAINALNGTEVASRELRVNEAKPRERRDSRDGAGR